MTKQPPTASALADFIKDRPRRRDAAAGSAGEPAGQLANGEGCGDFDMRIARDGTWFYHGSPIRRVELVKLFSTVLRRSEEHTSELQSLMRISYAVFCLQKKKN